MKSKSKITDEYLEMIRQVELKVEAYEEYLSSKSQNVAELSTGNRGIEEIVEEIEKMQKLVNKLKEENEEIKSIIRLNEYKF